MESTLNNFTEEEVLARTLYGEARGELLKYGHKALWAIGHVIINRYKEKTWYGKTVKDICLKPYQFSCWNKNDPNFRVLTQHNIIDDIFALCKKISGMLLFHLGNEDFTNGANHYHSKLILPPWAKDKRSTYTIGNHIFYKL